MKKFFNYNGLFTGCPPIILPNIKTEKDNLSEENNTQIEDNFIHYPQDNINNNEEQPQNYDNQGENFDKEEKSNEQKIDKDNSLSEKAKILLNCMQTHDKIIRNFEK